MHELDLPQVRIRDWSDGHRANVHPVLAHEKQQEFEWSVEFFGTYSTGIGISSEQWRVWEERGAGEGGSRVREGRRKMRKKYGWLDSYDIGSGSAKQGPNLRFSWLSQFGVRSEFYCIAEPDLDM